ncbi:MAG: SDR family NAD(P)-dependent oxidoreductase [Acidimicrobiales bacterium]
MGSAAARWTIADIGPLEGRVAIVTGASDGLGLAAAQALHGAGATVMLACRNETKGERARRSLGPDTERAELGLVDLSDLNSVAAFAHRFLEGHDRLDLLVNNAGVMMPPPTLVDLPPVDEAGDPVPVELQWATNHLGHHALTGRLLPILIATGASRVVTVSSVAAATGQLDGYDPTTLRGHQRFQAYANSKLANLVFALELDRRFRRAGAGASAAAAHPGVTHTNLSHGIGMTALAPFIRAMSWFTTQPVEAGVTPILRAATEDGAGGRYYGPAGWRQYRGRPVPVTPPAGAADPEVAARLFARSTELTGIAVEP